MLLSAGTVKVLPAFFSTMSKGKIGVIGSEIRVTSLEQFVVHRALRPVGRGGNGVPNQSERTANINMGTGPPDAEQCFQIEASRWIAAVEMGLQTVAVPGAQFVQKGRFTSSARAVVQRVISAKFGKTGGHRHHRRDADTARDQYGGFASFVEREVITWR